MDGRIYSLAEYKRRHMTGAERRLWFRFFACCGMRVFSQAVIEPYIVDFLIPDHYLIVEIDGSGHYTGSGPETDESKRLFFESLGFQVAHYSNNDVKHNLSGVCDDILHRCGII